VEGGLVECRSRAVVSGIELVAPVGSAFLDLPGDRPAHRGLGHGLDVKVSVEELDIGWNLGLKLKEVSLANQASMMRLKWVTVQPRLSGLISAKPEMDFSGGTSSGGYLSGSYLSGELSLSFKDISFKDFSAATLPVPSSTTMSGSGKLKFVTSNGTIDIEVDGVPGGTQRLRIPGGEGLGLDGKLKIAVSLPKL
jgi:hypothetical protein